MINRRKFKNILIFGHSNIGDVCYDLILAKPLRDTFPQARISFVTSAQAMEIAKSVKSIDEVIVFDKHSVHKGLSGYLRFISQIRRKHFDLNIILRDVQMHYFFGIPTQIKSKKKSTQVKQKHPAQKNIELLERIGISWVTPEFELDFSDKEEDSVNQIIGAVGKDSLTVGIMPFSAWRLKCWPVDKWNKLIEFLTGELTAKVFVFGKSSGSPWEEDFKIKLTQKAISLIDKCTLRESLAAIKKLDLFIGSDTSLLHFASCLHIPTIGLYGPTDHKVFYPFFHKNLVLSAESPLECMPCYRNPEVGPCGVKDNPAQCMLDITVEQVINKVKQVTEFR
ncbi:MAG: glycosyltransferase family 9 protein [Candidatus Omnitrophota bacterium]